jgi:plasmid maintenance system antidote protein VapI
MGGIGGTIGGILGAAAGTFVAPGLGTTAGASLGTGLGQLIQGGFQKKKAKGMSPSPEDVGERSLLNTLRRRQQMLSTGTAYNPQVVAGQQMAKAMQRNAFAAGGPVNQGMYSGLMSQALANITQQTSQDIANTLGIESKTITDMANTKRDLTLLPRSEGLAEASQNIKDSGQNLAAALQPQGDFSYNELGETPEEARKRKAAEAKAAKDAKDAAKNEGLTEG